MAAAKQHTVWVGRGNGKPVTATDPTNPFYDERLQGLADKVKDQDRAKMATTPSGPGGTSTRLAAWVKASQAKRGALESYWRGADKRAAQSAADAKAAQEERRKRIKDQIADVRNGGSDGSE